MRSWRFPVEERQTTVGLSGTAIANDLADYFFGNFRDEASVYYSDTQSVVSFSVISKFMTLNGYFAFNSVFAPIWLAPTVRLSKNNCVKTSKYKYTVSGANIRQGF